MLFEFFEEYLAFNKFKQILTFHPLFQYPNFEQEFRT